MNVTNEETEDIEAMKRNLDAARQNLRAFEKLRHIHSVTLADLRREVSGLQSLSDRLRRFTVACCAGSVITVGRLAELLNLPVADALILVNRHIHEHGLPDFGTEGIEFLKTDLRSAAAVEPKKDGDV